MPASSSPARLEPVAELRGHSDRVWNVAWHPTRQILASCGGDRTVRLWAPVVPAAGSSASSSSSSSSSATSAALPAWACVETIDDFTTRTVRSVAWSPCGRLLAAGSFDAKAYVWRVSFPDERGKCRAGGRGREEDGEEDEEQEDDRDDSDGAGGEDGGRPGRYHHHSGGEGRRRGLLVVPLATLDGHDHEVKGVAWAPGGGLLATSSRDKSVWVWEVDTEAAAAFAGGGRGGGMSGATGDEVDMVAALTGHSQDVKSVAWHPAHPALLASSSYDDAIRLWGDAGEDWACVAEAPGAHGPGGGTVWEVAWEPSRGSRLASVADDGSLQLWRAGPLRAGDPFAGSAAGVPGALTLEREEGGTLRGAHSRTAYSVSWAEEDEGGGSGGSGVGAGAEAGAGGEGGGGGVGSRAAPCRLATCGADDRICVFVEDAGYEAGGAASSRLVLSASAEGAHAGDVNCVRWQPPRLSRRWVGGGGGGVGGRVEGEADLVLASAGDDGLVKIWRYRGA